MPYAWAEDKISRGVYESGTSGNVANFFLAPASPNAPQTGAQPTASAAQLGPLFCELPYQALPPPLGSAFPTFPAWIVMVKCRRFSGGEVQMPNHDRLVTAAIIAIGAFNTVLAAIALLSF